jgi:hypothetical protein
MTPVKKEVCEQVRKARRLDQDGESLKWKIWAKIEVPVRIQVLFTAYQVKNQIKSKM